MKIKAKAISFITFILTFLILNSCGNSDKRENVKFDSESWKKGDFRMKGKMVNNIIKDSILIGKSKADVIELLGSQTESDTINQLVYSVDIGLKIGPLGLGGTWMFFMNVKFDSLEKKVIEVSCRD